MTGPEIWRPLGDELAHWRSLNLTAPLWLRDDDAVEPTDALDRLIGLTREFAVPVALAIIPARTDPALARHLGTSSHVHPLIHGWAHANHAPQREKKQELGPHRPRDAVLRDLSRAFGRMRELYGSGLVPMLVPPWNRIDPDLLDGLPALGFAGVSASGRKLGSRPGLIVANTQIDIVDSHAGNRCRDHGSLVASLVDELRASRAAGQRPIGILSHHLVSDDEAFRFLGDLFMAANRSGAVRWLTARDLLAHDGRSPHHPHPEMSGAAGPRRVK